MPKESVGGLRDAAASGDTSPSEEMYLITVAMAEQQGGEVPLPLASLAQSLSISPVSANQMVWRLTGRGLVDYHPYRGVMLTGQGRAAARRVLRGRRLWTSFLMERLGFGEDDADALACDLEHVTPPRVADRLEAFLGGPTALPVGEPIPPKAAAERQAGEARSSAASAGVIAVVPGAGDEDALATPREKGVWARGTVWPWKGTRAARGC